MTVQANSNQPQFLPQTQPKSRYLNNNSGRNYHKKSSRNRSKSVQKITKFQQNEINNAPNFIQDRLQKCPGKKVKMKIEEVHDSVICRSKRTFSTLICPCRSGGPCCQAHQQKSRRIQLYCNDGSRTKVKRIKILSCACRGVQCMTSGG